MEHISIIRVIADLAEQLIVRGRAQPRKLKWDQRPVPEGSNDLELVYGFKGGRAALYFRVNIVADNHGYEKDGRTYHEDWVRSFRRTVHVLITENHNVFTAVTGMHHPGVPDPAFWTNSSNHDSCWREDGLRVIRDVFAEAYEACWSQVSPRHQPAPKDLSTFTSFDWMGLNGKAFDYVIAYAQGVPDYRYQLIEIERMNAEVTLTRNADESDE